MADRIKKFLKSLNAKDLAKVHEAAGVIAAGDFSRVNVKALKGKPGYLRIRVGRVRIIAKRIDGGYEIVHITNRNEKTYKDMQV